MDLNHSSCWDSILEQVRPHIPTIDFDFSSSDNDENITLYQRPAGLSLEVPEDFDSFPMDDDALESDNDENITLYQRPAGLSLEVPEDFDSFPMDDDALEADACERAIVEMNDAKLDASTEQNVDNINPDAEGYPLLSFVRLDEWDLEDGLSLQQYVSAEPVKTKGGNKDRYQENIMEKPVAFFKNQSSMSVLEPVKSPNQIRQTNAWNSSSELQLSRRERPTVIDLCCPTPNPKSPTKHNTHKETSPAKKPHLKLHAGSQMEGREVTGKCMLLQKIREVKSNVESGTISEQQQQSDQERQPIEQTLQHQQHQQIFKKLEKHRLAKSVNQMEPAAERTDVLYHFEASYLQPVSTLPADIASKGQMLLIISLSTPGMIGDKNHLYPAATKSHIYNTLVAWFLSLVGPDPRHNEDEVGAKVPFWVAGLQQLWTENGLALHVLAVARHCYRKKKKQGDFFKPFYNHVCRFLSETKLTLIARWLPQLQILLDQQSYASTIHLPSSCLNSFISATSNEKLIDWTFGLSPGFYWQTVESQEKVCKGRDTNLELHTEVSVTVGHKAFFLDPFKTHYLLQLVLDSGLDVCGLRLLYPPESFLSDSAGAEPANQRTDADTCHPVLALAVRGPHALSVFKDLTTLFVPLMPKETESGSVNLLNCESEGLPLLSPSQVASQVHRELCLWFSGRFSGKDAQMPLNGCRAVPAHKTDQGSVFNPSRSLCATTKADLLLVVSPVVPPCCYGRVLAVYRDCSFGAMGLQSLDSATSSPYTVILDQKQQELPSHCLILILRKENAMHHSVSLPAALMTEMKAQKLLRLDGVPTVEPNMCFHIVPYSSDLFYIFVRRMWAAPDPSRVILSRLKHSSASDTEQVVVLTLCGKDLSQGLSLLHRVLTDGPRGFELLCLKFLTALTRSQAREVTPYEVGERLCQGSVGHLMSSPALVCALRQVDAFALLRKLLPRDYPGDLSVLLSATPEVAFRQASVFFLDHEMTPEPTIGSLLKFTPENCSTEDRQMLLTVCVLKPRLWCHSLAEIVQLSGLALVGLCVFTMDQSTAASILPAESDPADLEAQVEYLCFGSSLALCLHGEDAVRRLQDVLSREKSSLWATCCDTAHSYNGIYASGSYQKAIQDVKRLFPEGLCCSESSAMRQEQILSLCSDSLASVKREQSSALAPVAQEELTPFMTSGPNEGSQIHSALWQTTCLLIPVNAPPLSQVPPQLELLEQLLRSGCYLVAGRMSVLDSEQRKHIAETLQGSPRGNERMAHLSMAPCLILALQGETLVSCFDSLLESINKEQPDMEEVGKMSIYPDIEEEAERLICYLFDSLSPESCHDIVP